MGCVVVLWHMHLLRLARRDPSSPATGPNQFPVLDGIGSLLPAGSVDGPLAPALQ
jgi:hypothetical protein